MDESTFIKINGVKFWIIGARNNKTGNIRVDLFKTRTENDMKTFIYKHININNIIADSWNSYTHETFSHGPNGNFGFGVHFSNQIESVWSTLQAYIKRIYIIIPDDNFILFLREAEMWYRFRNKSNEDIEKEFKE